MDNTNEADLVRDFLKDFKERIETRTRLPFNPRHLTIITQPDMKDSSMLEWISYHKWFDEIQYGVSLSQSNNLIQVFLEQPIHALIEAEELGKPLISKKDEKKLAKALKLISEIKVRRQDEENSI